MPSFIENVNIIRENLDDIIGVKDLFSQEVVDKIGLLANIDLTPIIQDLRKGNYLGNRKIDVDLALNNTSMSEMPTYRQADIILVNGTKLEIPFDNGSGGVLELSSHTDIKSYIQSHLLYAQVVDTEIVIYEAFGSSTTIMRIRDADGKASNIERLELLSYAGSVIEVRPSYFWAKTTSSLETLANRAGDIIQLGNDIDSIVLLSQRIEELVSLQDNISNILLIHTNLANIITTSNNIIGINLLSSRTIAIDALNSNILSLTDIHSNLAEILDADTNAAIATAQAVIASTKANESLNSANTATAQATIATAKANEIKGITAQATTLVAGSLVSVSYNPVDGKFTFGIPQGIKGDRGEAFKVNALGQTVDKATYNTQPKDFSFLDLTLSLLYFKNSDTSADWSAGIPFGKGDIGNPGATGNGIVSIVHFSGTGAAGTNDVYRITMSNATTFDFSVHNGTESVTSVAGKIGTVLLAKSDVGLGNVDNTSDISKPISTLTQTALNLKANQNTTYTKIETDNRIQLIVGAAPAALDTLIELGAQLQADESAAAALTTAVSFKADQSAMTTALGFKDSINFVKPSMGVPLFTKASASSIIIPIGTSVKVGVNIITVSGSPTPLPLSLNSVGIGALDTGTKAAGTDYYVYTLEAGGFILSANATNPTGYTTANSRKIGGFHYGLVPEAFTAINNIVAADVTKIAGINAYSFWDLKFMPSCGDARGMFKANTGKWYDIYLLNTDHHLYGTSAAGKTIAGGAVLNGRNFPKIPLFYGGNGTTTYGTLTWFEASEIGKAYGKDLISYEEFAAIAYGVLEASSASTTDTGSTQHLANYTSKFGMCMATGCQWVWGKDLIGPVGAAWNTNTEGRGSILNASLIAALFGGGRDEASASGSRASSWYFPVWVSGWAFGCRYACDHLELA